MQKTLVLTDLHITRKGKRIIGLDPGQRLTEVLDHACANHSDAARLIVTGDLTHYGSRAEYTRLKTLLSSLPFPVTLTLGNHDIREKFFTIFPDAPRTDAGFAQEVIDMGDTRLVVLDTLHKDATPQHAGHLCAQRLDWMDDAITGAGGRRVVLFMHHPPIVTGFGGMDAIGLTNRAELAQRLSRHPNVAHIIAGHIHRTIHAGLPTSAQIIPISVLKSPCHQMPMHLGPASPHLSIDEPGAYGIVLLGADGIVVHSEDVFPAALENARINENLTANQ